MALLFSTAEQLVGFCPGGYFFRQSDSPSIPIPPLCRDPTATLHQCRFNVGPASVTLVQHLTGIGATSRTFMGSLTCCGSIGALVEVVI